MNYRIWKVYGVLSAACIAASMGVASADPPNLVQNGDFNQNADGWALIGHPRSLSE